ncbi:hypothetical protein K474DRAFT_1665103 [Panus rudis PR-1116 ss-1]|nr:hypothetical protein K474DRAFT_1665103 [Panus rudis PR-1116 ss-1]
MTGYHRSASSSISPSSASSSSSSLFNSTAKDDVTRTKSMHVRPLPKTPRPVLNSASPLPNSNPPRPLPAPPITPSPSTSTRTCISPRPLPTPLANPPSPDGTPRRPKHSSERESNVERTPRNNASHASPPKLKLMLGIPASVESDHFVESPLEPLSPIVFAKRRHRDTEEDDLTKRLATLGFQEASAASAQVSTKSSTHDFLFLLQDAECDSAIEAPPEIIDLTNNLHLNPAAPPARTRRYSRLWVREKKGKRYVEEDENDILRELRKLRSR